MLVLGSDEELITLEREPLDDLDHVSYRVQAKQVFRVSRHIAGVSRAGGWGAGMKHVPSPSHRALCIPQRALHLTLATGPCRRLGSHLHLTAEETRHVTSRQGVPGPKGWTKGQTGAFKRGSIALPPPQPIMLQHRGRFRRSQRLQNRNGATRSTTRERLGPH